MREWTDRELSTMKEAHDKKVCVFNLKWGKCKHFMCQQIWSLTPETAQPEEAKAIWGGLFA